ncbi:MAG TPA: DNA repair protein RecN, partial [Steroidobacteraceae bacterium]|nr:DNA repair protein RecN [Steroidobacteraceae bacterium]
MLIRLEIRDFAIIESIELELYPGLTVLTGETGAGKSILVDALQLLAGGRAGPEMIRHGAERAEITATFDLRRAPPGLMRWLEEQSIDRGDELMVRRVLSADGRSRAYVNGQSIPVLLLREVGSILIDIHGQHEFQSLTRAAAQRELLDEYGKLEPLAGQVGIAFRVWREMLERSLELESRARDREAKLDLLKYQAGELQALSLEEGEVAGLTEERSRLLHRGRLAEAAQMALAALYQAEDSNAHANVSRALQSLRAASALDPKLAPVATLAEEAAVQIREAARELERYGESLELDTQRQQDVERRLAAIEELARKHHVTPLELLARATQLTAELEGLERAEVDLAVLRKDLATALDRYREEAQALSAKRTAAATALAKDISKRMQTLGMSGGRLEVDVAQSRTAEPAQHGIDDVELRVSTNPGQPPRALAKIASGGELSRLSLAVQVAGSAQETRSMVFDEVDSGIGGAVAEIVGRELRALGERGQ